MSKNPAKEHTNQFINNAHKEITTLAQAVNAHFLIHDHNGEPVPETAEQLLTKKNPCIFCAKYNKNMDVKSTCRKMHINAIMESHHGGGSHTYTCNMGCHFWASPVYYDERLAGALVGRGFSRDAKDELYSKMHEMCRGSLNKDDLVDTIENFPMVEPLKIKSLSELALICAKSISVRSEGCHASMERLALHQQELSAKVEEIKNRNPAESSKPEYSLEKEKELLEALKRGDTKSAMQILNDILADMITSEPREYKSIQYRAIELAVLLSRLGAHTGFNTRTMIESNNLYIKLIQETGNVEELCHALYKITDDLTIQMNSFRELQHSSALKRAESFILENFTRKISLEEIAKISGFSSPYFSTIFKEEMGENLSSYLNRLRVEKARTMLKGTNYALSKIAGDCGFEDQSWFSKIFKQYTGMSPGKYRSHSL